LKIASLVLVVIWAVVLLVPAFNYYFRLQVRDESEMNTILAILPSPQNTPNFWEKTARRFPENRDILYQAAMERPISEIKGEKYSSDESYQPFRLARNLPPSVVFPGRMAADERNERVRRIGLIRQKFPEDAFLVAAEIRARLFSLERERIGGELSDGTPKDKRPPGYVSPESNGEKVNFAPVDFEKAIALCRLGQKLEPENGYFDWMECYFLMHSWRDAQALKALEAVGRKKNYDDHLSNDKRAEINALSIVWGRPLLYEEKAVLLSSHINAQNSRYRELARVLAWEAIKAQRRGDQTQAFRIAVALGRATTPMWNNSQSYIDGMVAKAIGAIGWHSLTYDLRASLPKGWGGKEPRKKQDEILLTFLKEHGKPELAAEVARNEMLFQKFRTQMQENGNRAAFGISYRTAFFIVLLWVGGIKLILLLLASAFPLFLMAAIKRTAAMRRWLRWEESSFEEFPSVREVCQGVLACIGWRAWAIALCGFLIVSLVEVIFLGGWSSYTKQLQEMPFLKVLFQDETATWYYSPWTELYLSLIEVSYIESPWRIAVFCVPILFGTLYSVWRAVEWQKRSNGEVSAWLSIGRVVDFVIMLVLVWSFFVQVFAEDTPEDFTTRLILALVTFVCAAVLLGEKFLVWRKRPQRRATVRYGLRLLQRSLFSWLMVGSVIYLLTLVATTIVRHRADIEIDRVVAMGEVKAAQERGE